MRVFLTDKGKEIDRVTKEKVETLEKQFASVLTEEENRQLCALLRKVIDGFHAESASSPCSCKNHLSPCISPKEGE